MLLTFHAVSLNTVFVSFDNENTLVKLKIITILNYTDCGSLHRFCFFSEKNGSTISETPNSVGCTFSYKNPQNYANVPYSNVNYDTSLIEVTKFSDEVIAV